MSQGAARQSPHGQELPLLERRRAYVVHRLMKRPEVRYTFELANGCLRPEPGAPVSMMLAIRTGDGILTGELQVPRERFEVDAIIGVLETHGRVA